MRIISKKKLIEAIELHPELKVPLMTWYAVIKNGEFRSIEALRETFPSADPVGRATVFNIKGNHFRLITAIHYDRQITYVLEVLTHAEYTKNKWKSRYHIDC